ncbi:hypothetical protein [Haloarchaeobius sp. HME9146]|uniref:hypothetical protein n=1 Tax=Haloarchaeobius sp. HME9146 TaxID=2978732 RepID=UPI0021C25092|nr:hypothetical protein [Haloarchaeobius sp. HME9146]MCT9096765.1 hypothetical protein [Haloarchaeobius sp. HME9146]
MGLSVETPAPPELEFVDPNEYEDATVAADADYRREELEEFLHEGAWERSWNEWAEHTDLTEEEFEIAADMNLFERFDFFWDDFADRVGYHAPGIPEDWKERNYHPDLQSWGTVSGINAALTELGQVVCDVLKNEYIDWEAEYEPPEDLPDF